MGGGGLSRFVARVEHAGTCWNIPKHAGTPNMFRSTSMFGVSDLADAKSCDV